MLGLFEVSRHPVGNGEIAGQHVPHGPTADFGCGRSVAFHQRRRNTQRVRDVVESFARIVGGQQRRRVYIEREQIADSVRVFRSIQAMEPGKTGVGIGSPRAIEFTFELGGKSIHGRAIRPRRASRRHHAGANFADNLFPDLGVRAGMRVVKLVQH